jgi:hypothetical protein
VDCLLSKKDQDQRKLSDKRGIETRQQLSQMLSKKEMMKEFSWKLSDTLQMCLAPLLGIGFGILFVWGCLFFLR